MWKKMALIQPRIKRSATILIIFFFSIFAQAWIQSPIGANLSCRLSFVAYGFILNDTGSLQYVGRYEMDSDGLTYALGLSLDIKIEGQERNLSESCKFHLAKIEDYAFQNGNVTPVQDFQEEFIKCPSPMNDLVIDKGFGRNTLFLFKCTSSTIIDLEWSPIDVKMLGKVYMDYTRSLNAEGSIRSYGLIVTTAHPTMLSNAMTLSSFLGRFKIFSKIDKSLFLDFTLIQSEDEQVLTEDHRVPIGISFEETIPLGGFPRCYLPQRDFFTFGNLHEQNVGEVRLEQFLCNDKKCPNMREGLPFFQLPGFKYFKQIHQSGILTCANLTLSYFIGLNLAPIELRDNYNVTHEDNSNFYFDDTDVVRLKLNDDKSKIMITSPPSPREMAEARNSNETMMSRDLQVYEKDVYKFECQFVSFILTPPVVWSVHFHNGSKAIHLSESSVLKDEIVTVLYTRGLDNLTVDLTFKTTYFQLNISENVKNISCGLYHGDSDKFVRSWYNFQVEPSQPPSFSLTRERSGVTEQATKVRKITKEVGDPFEIPCKIVEGQPKVEFSWTHNDQVFENNSNCRKIVHNESLGMSTLYFCNGAPEQNGRYRCHVKNFLGTDYQEFEVTVSKNSNAWIYYTIFGILLLICIAISSFAYRKHRTQRMKLSKMEIELFLKGNDKEISRQSDRITNLVSPHLPYKNEYEIPFTDFKIEDKELGKGEYGVVMKGRIGTTDVAAKTIHPFADKAHLLALLSELKIMMYLEKHNHIVSLIGASTSMLDEGRAYIFVEFCELGSLHSFLLQHRTSYNLTETMESPQKREAQKNSVDDAYVELEETAGVTGTAFKFSDLLLWSEQIALGMEFLASKNVIHADLATRNILMKSMKMVKVTDFGLSRMLHNCSSYRKKTKTPLPFRSMAIESLRDMIFTTKSDVWSYGCTVWEIFALGATPFPGITWTHDFVSSLEQGLRLSKPKYSNDKIYNVLLQCWSEDPDQRPTMSQLKDVFRFERFLP